MRRHGSIIWVLGPDGEPMPCSDLEEWVKKLELDQRIICRDEINGMLISTVFLGIDQAFGYSDEPILFETMVFCNTDNHYLSRYQRRYSSRMEAEEGHKEVVQEVLAAN